ncbi:MAG: polysaccharide deacetylase family protein [Planctomycetales bacterium]|nr:polysaccharide deacetylase family protein [Planctomycetales bacterium]
MSHFIISLDFELLWGLRDHHSRASYGKNMLGVREAIPRMLDLFHSYEIGATWATVGMLMCESRDELLDISSQVRQPRYATRSLSNYAYLDEVGETERSDPYYFGLSLVRQIQSTPRQHVGTHTFSHYYCLEDGASVESFRSDIVAAQTVANRRGISLRSIVFPRNQYDAACLQVCHDMGICCFRGNQQHFVYRPSCGSKQTKWVRALRLFDAHTGVFGHQAFKPRWNVGLMNLPASRFLRPNTGKLASVNRAHILTILRGMTHAATHGNCYHLWWHPHNFGSDVVQNLKSLQVILDHYRILRDSYGFVSSSMEDVFDANLDTRRTRKINQDSGQSYSGIAS